MIFIIYEFWSFLAYRIDANVLSNIERKKQGNRRAKASDRPSDPPTDRARERDEELNENWIRRHESNSILSGLIRFEFYGQLASMRWMEKREEEEEWNQD